MKHKRNIFGQSILEELRRQREDINLSSEHGRDEFSETEMLNQSGVDLPEPTAPKNKRDENEPLLVKLKRRCHLGVELISAEMVTQSLIHLCWKNHLTAIQVWALKKGEKVMMELDADGQGRDNGANLFVRFLGQVARQIMFCPISIKRWDKMPEDNTKR
ncbi:hypothetical protein Ahy_B08g090226 [Arachis hypogaea]|uniref:Uncharacterized protein n=1 Tax=Arachis hypogaea TaxID=3818 RepID=A0A444XZS6_ARAHY|nr:hypothetical protein Ahy_B08g090226 [Arachis hypogaea]